MSRHNEAALFLFLIDIKVPPVILDLFVSISLYHTFFCPSNLGRRHEFILLPQNLIFFKEKGPQQEILFVILGLFKQPLYFVNILYKHYNCILADLYNIYEISKIILQKDIKCVIIKLLNAKLKRES